jgi:hypothetical protein
VRLNRNHAEREKRFFNMVPFKIEQLPLNLKEEVEQFLADHPRSPAARLRPDMGVARNMWLAFIGPDLREGNAGVGHTPREALEDFNRHFMEPLISRNGHEPSLSA